jgi:hypothetical protein
MNEIAIPLYSRIKDTKYWKCQRDWENGAVGVGKTKRLALANLLKNEKMLRELKG